METSAKIHIQSIWKTGEKNMIRWTLRLDVT